MKRPPVQPRTRLAHAAAKWADDKGVFNAFNNEVFKAFFQEGLDIGKLEVLSQIAEKLDMEPNELGSGPQMNAYMRQVINDENNARQANVRAVPAYVANGRVLAAGVQSLAQLQRMLFQP